MARKVFTSNVFFEDYKTTPNIKKYLQLDKSKLTFDKIQSESRQRLERTTFR